MPEILPYNIQCIDGALGLSNLEDHSVKLIYGSPPYPNVSRNYGRWRSSDYIERMAPFIDEAVKKLTHDGFLVINVKANREPGTSKMNSRRSLVIERLAIELEDRWGLYCVDIEIWIKSNPIATGLRAACQDAYEQNLWFSVNPLWTINIDAIRRPYSEASLQSYSSHVFKPRTNGVGYVRKEKKITPNPLGALPWNIIYGSVSGLSTKHQAVQPEYLPEKYIKACTQVGDLIVDPWVGTGTTGASAIRLGRRFIGFDILPEHVDMAMARLSDIYYSLNK
jgi:modification methylase dpnIIB